MSADFSQWCASQLSALGSDADYGSLTQFLMTLQSDAEIKEYLHEYLGTGDKIDEFADGFLQLKAFESGGAKESSSKVEEEDGKAQKNRRRKKNQEF